MWEEIESFLAPYRTQTLFVGCSGGVDSMALLHYLHTNQFKVHALHINYHKRGTDSDADQALIQEYCLKLGIPLSYRDFIATSKGNFQEQARLFRYHFFEEMANKENGMIAMAHHADDQVETFCMNLMRKSGVLGLAGIPPIRKNYLRPFLNISKDTIIEYAKKNNVPWREDSSNHEAHYLRNKWRLEFIPFMEAENPTFKTSILTLVTAFQATQKELELAVMPLVNHIKTNSLISLKELSALSTEQRFELWRQLEQPSNLYQRFEELLTYNSGKQINGTGKLKRVYNYQNTIHFDYGNHHKIPAFKQSIVEELPETFSKNEIYLDPSKVQGTLKLRTIHTGDRIASLGVKGTQLVSKIIKDANIPTHERSSILVLHDDKEILWVVGLKVSRNVIADKSKKTHLKVEF